MDKGIDYYVIDFSKDLFDVLNLKNNYCQFENNFKGF